MAVEKIQVVGAGQMGSGIAQVAAQAGLSVYLSDVDEEAIEKGLETIKKHLARSVEKERISQDEMDEALERIESGTEYAPDADLAIEAVVETIEAKKEVFRALRPYKSQHYDVVTLTTLECSVFYRVSRPAATHRLLLQSVQPLLCEI